ncbi:MAG: hypothetical protein ABEI97_04550, partial [Candidatus Nanohaloarchaea archaeon]
MADDVGPEHRIQDQVVVSLLREYEEVVDSLAQNYTVLTEHPDLDKDDTYDAARQHINYQDWLLNEFYDEDDGFDKDAILDMGMEGMEEFAEFVGGLYWEARSVNNDLYDEIMDSDFSGDPAGPGGDGDDSGGGDNPVYNMFFLGGEGGDAEATIEEGAVSVDAGGDGGDGEGGYDGDGGNPTAHGGDAAASDVEVEGTDTTPIGEGLKAVAAALEGDEDDGGDGGEEDYDA